MRKKVDSGIYVTNERQRRYVYMGTQKRNKTKWIRIYVKMKDNVEGMHVTIRDKVDIHMYVENERQRRYVCMLRGGTI